MPGGTGPVVVAVCGSPGAGKTTVGSAVARRLGVPALFRDELKNGLGLSSASAPEGGGLEFAPDFHIAGGPVSTRAEAAMIAAAQLLASARVSFVVESSVLSRRLLDALLACDASVLAVHVVAAQAVIGERLRARLADGRAVDRQLDALFRSGQMDPSIFQPPDGAHAVIKVDTSDCVDPIVEPVEAAVLALLRSRGRSLSPR